MCGVRISPRRVPQLRVSGQRLRLRDVQGGTGQRAGAERGHHRALVHGGAPAGVHEPRVPRQQRQHRRVERAVRLQRRGQQRDQDVRRRQHLRQPRRGHDRMAVPLAVGRRHARHPGTERREQGSQLGRDRAEAPDHHVRATQRELGLGACLLASQVAVPLVPALGLQRPVEAAHGGEQQGQGVLGDGGVVQSPAGGDHDVRGEPGGQRLVRPRVEGLHPAQPGQPPRRVVHDALRARPRDDRLGVEVLGRHLFAHHVGDGLDPLDVARQVERDVARHQDLHASDATRAAVPGWPA